MNLIGENFGINYTTDFDSVKFSFIDTERVKAWLEDFSWLVSELRDNLPQKLGGIVRTMVERVEFDSESNLIFGYILFTQKEKTVI